MLRQRRGVIRNNDPWKLDRVAQRSVARLWQRQALNNAAQNRHRGDGDQSEEPDLVTQRGRFDATDFQPRPNASEQNGGLPAPHEQPRRGFGRRRDEGGYQRVHSFPPFFDMCLMPFYKPEFAPPSTRRWRRVGAHGWRCGYCLRLMWIAAIFNCP